MKVKTLMKLSLMGLLAMPIAIPMAMAYAQGDDAKEVAPRKKKAKKSKKGVPAPTRMVVAINKFENKSDAADSLFETIRARVQQCVVGARKFEVVEREQLKAAMSEQTLVASGLTDGEDVDAPEAGKMKAASYIVYGNVLYCGNDKAGGSAEGVASSTVKSKVELQIKIANGETGKILTQKSAVGYGVDKALATAEFSSSTGQGMRDAIDEACHMAADALRDVAYPAKVIKVGRKDITINMTDESMKRRSSMSSRRTSRWSTPTLVPSSAMTVTMSGVLSLRALVRRSQRRSPLKMATSDLMTSTRTNTPTFFAA